jgi:hypothetical protein
MDVFVILVVILQDHVVAAELAQLLRADLHAERLTRQDVREDQALTHVVSETLLRIKFQTVDDVHPKVVLVVSYVVELWQELLLRISGGV